MYLKWYFSEVARPSSSVGCASTWYSDGHGFDPQVRQNILSRRLVMKSFSSAILFLPLIQVGQLSVTGKRMCTQYWLTTYCRKPAQEQCGYSPYIMCLGCLHLVGEVKNRVSVMPRKVTGKIGDAENRCQGCRGKNQWKKAKIPVWLVLSWVPGKSRVWN